MTLGKSSSEQASGMRAAPAGRSPPSSAGLVGIQTSDTNELSEIAFVARDLREASRAFALSSRLRKMKLVVGHHADTVRDLFAQAGIAVDCIMVTLTYAPGVACSPRQITSYVRVGARAAAAWRAALPRHLVGAGRDTPSDAGLHQRAPEEGFVAVPHVPNRTGTLGACRHHEIREQRNKRRHVTERRSFVRCRWLRYGKTNRPVARPARLHSRPNGRRRSCATCERWRLGRS